MNLWQYLFPRQVVRKCRAVNATHRVAISSDCVKSLRSAIHDDITNGHEGVAYLLGAVGDGYTLIAAVYSPKSTTTYGSFNVDKLAMAKVMRAAAKNNLQVVGQIHTHPGEAYHSDGDDEGAPIAYDGYVSIVIPDHGMHLPSLEGMAAFVFESGKGFSEIPNTHIKIIEAHCNEPRLEESI